MEQSNLFNAAAARNLTAFSIENIDFQQILDSIKAEAEKGKNRLEMRYLPKITAEKLMQLGFGVGCTCVIDELYCYAVISW